MVENNQTMNAGGSYVDVEILHLGWDDTDDETAAEIFHGRDFDLIDEDVFESSYESLGEPVEIEAIGLTTGELLGEIWERTQGGRDDKKLPYDGTKVRSSCVGDIFVLDGTPYVVAGVGFEEVDVDVGQDDELPPRPSTARPDGEGVRDPHAHQRRRFDVDRVCGLCEAGLPHSHGESEDRTVDEAEIEAEAEQQARYERHVDRRGWH